MASRYGTAQQAYNEGRKHGIVTGLGMAAKYLSMTESRDEVIAMIKAALLTLTEPAK